MATTTESRSPSANGELINRVQQLRLAGQLGAGKSGGGRGSWLPWVLCAMMAVTWAGVGVRWYKSAESTGDNGANAAKAPATTAAPQPGAQPTVAPGELVLQIKGTLIPSLQINLSPDDISGTVTEIFFKEGDRVEKGKKLATIRDDRYRNDYVAAKAAMEGAKARLDEMSKDAVRTIEKEQAQAEWDEADANRDRAKKELQRLNSQRAGGVVSQQDLDKAEAELRAADARVIRMAKAKEILVEGPRKEKVDAARADLENAKARYEEAERMLKNCTVLAPIDGTILTKAADRGMLVSPMSFNVAAGICSMADLTDLETEIEVREDQINAIKIGQECEIVATAYPNKPYKGRVDRIMPIADDTKNIIKVRVKVQLPPNEEPGSFLKPKMTSVVRVYNKIIPESGAGKN